MTTVPGLTILFDASSQPLSSTQRTAIRGHVEATFRAAQPAIPITGVTARVTVDPSREIPGWAMGGYAHGPGEIELVVSPEVSTGTLAARLPSVVAHELHHVARFRGPGYGTTLLGAMVSEGLADHFARDLVGAPLPPWVLALGENEIELWIERARPELDSTTFDFGAWFFGFGGEIPRWAGYAIGFRLVSDYLADHPGTSAASLVHVDASALRPD